VSIDIAQLCVGCMGERGPTAICEACGWDDRREQDVQVALPYRTVLHDQYVFGRALGHGGFGITYIGWDLNLDMKVAIKEFLPGDSATRSGDGRTVTPYSGQREYFDWGLNKFLDEGRALARFNGHPNIVTVLNFFREHGTGYLVMSYVPGRTFQEYLDEQGGRIAPGIAARILMPVMDALREVHAAGLLHRDISPDNIYLTDAGQVKVIDFGAARYAMGTQSKNLSVVLKPGFAPWEQYQSRGNQGPWTDVYAVGATMYRAITGVPPPPAPDRIDRDELVPPSQMGIAIEPHQEAALMKAMAVKVEQRFPSVADLQQPLLSLLDGQAGVVPPNRLGGGGGSTGGAGGTGSGTSTGGSTAMPAVEDIVARLASVSERIRRTQQRLIPAIAMPAAFQPTMAMAAAIVAGLISVFGAMWSFNELMGLSPGSQVFAAFFPLLVPINKVALVSALLADLAMILGAVQWIRSDARGPGIVWAAAWTLAGLTVVSTAGLLVAAPMTPGWSAIAGPTRSAVLGTAVGAGVTALVQLAIVIGLMWKGGAKPAS
jgi:hypothetical protein